jgi:hypothetical protein
MGIGWRRRWRKGRRIDERYMCAESGVLEFGDVGRPKTSATDGRNGPWCRTIETFQLLMGSGTRGEV